MKKLLCLLFAVCAVLGIFFTLPALNASASSSVENGTVSDASGNALYRHVQNGIVFNSLGQVAYDNTSSPIYYNPATKEFTNDKQDILTVFDRDNPALGKFLRNGNYQVRSVAISDTFYKFPMKDGTQRYVSMLWADQRTDLQRWLGVAFYGIFEFYDLLGTRIPASEINIPNLDSLLGQYAFIHTVATLKMIDIFEPATLFDLLEKIEIVSSGASIHSVKDDRGRDIRVINGQLFDYMEFPLVGTDSKPLFYSGGEYFGIDGRVLSVVNGYLIDGLRPVHSVVTDFLAGQPLYFLTMRDGITICPLLGTPQTDTKGYYNGNVSFAYLDGTPIKTSDFNIPAISDDDIYTRYPELKPPLDYASDFDIFAWLSSFFSGFDTSGLGGILDLVLMIVGLMLLIAFLPLIIKLIVFVGSALFALVEMLFKGVSALFKKIFVRS